MKRRLVTFVGPRQIEVATVDLQAPEAGKVIVQTRLSAISAGTEMLLYRGAVSADAASAADPISQGLSFPTPFGYAAVGFVIEAGPGVETDWVGRRVFAFQPHASHFSARPTELLAVPDDVATEDAVFLANAESAVSLVQDAAPVLGDRVLVLGQGVVGLLATALLGELPLSGLVAVDGLSRRRAASAELGVTVLDPAATEFVAKALSLSGADGSGYDVTLELSGNPGALDDGIRLTRFAGRIVVGSWYGTKLVPVHLGGRFHRSRITIVASQVSTIPPALAGRWDKARRLNVAWDAIRRISPSRWITQRLPVGRAVEAYRSLDRNPGDSVQIVFEYQ